MFLNYVNSDDIFGQIIYSNPRRACAARVRSIVVVRVSVCYHYSGTTGYESAKERYQRPERYVGIVFKKAIFLKLLRSRVMA